MKRSFTKILAVASAIVSLVSCGGSDKPLLPNVSGKAGEVIVVMDKSDWDGNLGSSTRELLAADYPFLPQREPLFSVVDFSYLCRLCRCNPFKKRGESGRSHRTGRA